jgi:Flp pilus assembly protein TadB
VVTGSTARAPSTDAAEGRLDAGGDRTARERGGLGAGLVVLALPVLCCAGPVLVAALAAASAAVLGLVAGLVGVALAALAAALVLRRRRREGCTRPLHRA